MAKAFVTGGSGFVGRNLIRALVTRGDVVRALARSDKAAEAVRALGAEPVRGDLQDFRALRDGMTGREVVFHAAAEVSEWGDPKQFHDFNVVGTQNVLTAARAAGVARFIHVSTEAVLADGQPLMSMDETRPRPAKPVPRYPATKAESEKLVQEANSPQMQTVVVRPRLIWGADDTSLLPQMVEAVKTGRFMWMNGGHYLTSTTHVANVVEGLLLAAERGKGGQIYFVTDGAPVEFRDFVTKMLATQGVDPGSKSVPRHLAWLLAVVSEWLWNTFGLKGKPPVTRLVVYLMGDEVTINDTKARRELGYQARKTREAGFAEMKRMYN